MSFASILKDIEVGLTEIITFLPTLQAFLTSVTALTDKLNAKSAKDTADIRPELDAVNKHLEKL